MATNETAALVVEARFKFEKQTKGALRYAEVDEKDEVIEQAWAKIGSLYLRKSAFARGTKFPRQLSVTIQCEGEVDGPTLAST
jgi:hypothetical protein